MFFNGIAGLVILLGLLVLFAGLRLLFRKGWFGAWLRGMTGIALLAASVLMIAVATDLISYRQMASDEPLGTISFTKTGPQAYRATLSLAEHSEEQVFELKGDQWQMDARIIRWHGLFAGFAKPGYRLDRISGRYFSLDDELSAERTVYPLFESSYRPDVWQWLQDNGQFMPWIDATYGSATFVPMQDGALYEVALTASSLAARPLNDPAREAIRQWR